MNLRLLYTITTLLAVSSRICTAVNNIGAYTMPYTRYEADSGTAGSKCIIRKSLTHSNDSTASEASGQCYTELSEKGASISWEIRKPANAISIRYNLPDSSSCRIDIKINGRTVKTENLTSFWMYEYILKGVPGPSYVPGCFTLARFDETHFLIPDIGAGDILSIENTCNVPLGIDYIELEKAGAPIERPHGSVSVTDYGAIADDDNDDLEAFVECIGKAAETGKTVYIPAGYYILSDRLEIFHDGIKITGAGIWHTDLMFTNTRAGHGGFFANAADIEISDFYCNTVNNRRMDNGKNRNYKCFSGTYRGKSVIHDIWENHFTVGVWTAGYNGEKPTDGLTVKNSRIRYNYADGINFAHGTSNSVVAFCNIRSCGDDGLASFSSSNAKRPVPPCSNNSFVWNTVESVWRASGIGIFGGKGHSIRHCLISECIGSSGIRFTSDFPGNPFDKKEKMSVSDCRIIRCGTRRHLYEGVYGAIELHGKRYDVCNIAFERIDIIDSQTDGIRLVGDKVKDISFRDIDIRGAGTDMKNGGKDNPQGHRGCGIFCSSTNSPGTNMITLEDISISGCPDGNIVNVNNSFKINCKPRAEANLFDYAEAQRDCKRSFK